MSVRYVFSFSLKKNEIQLLIFQCLFIVGSCQNLSRFYWFINHDLKSQKCKFENKLHRYVHTVRYICIGYSRGIFFMFAIIKHSVNKLAHTINFRQYFFDPNYRNTKPITKKFFYAYSRSCSYHEFCTVFLFQWTQILGHSKKKTLRATFSTITLQSDDLFILLPHLRPVHTI